jgi:CMP-2-keto-3-deoxyoctulosonic acid synthetase
MQMLGALNVIDNTRPISIGSAKSGDLIMTKWNPTLGHTRIIHSVRHVAKINKYEVVWYQGNLPPVKPEMKKDYFSKYQ